MGYMPSLSGHERSCTPEIAAEFSLNDDLLLLRVYTTLRVLRSDGNQALASGQRRREIVKCAVGGHDRHFPPVDHDASIGFGLAGHFNDVAMLDQGIDFEVDGDRVLAFGDNRETVFFALDRFFS